MTRKTINKMPRNSTDAAHVTKVTSAANAVEPGDDTRDQCMDEALDLYRHLTACLETSVVDAAHCLIGCGLFVIGADLPLDEALENLQFVRAMIDEREAELRAGRS